MPRICSFFDNSWAIRAIFFCLVADTFEIGDGLDYGHQHAQVTGSRLAANNNTVAALIDFNLKRVDAVVVGNHAIHQNFITVDQCFEGKLYLTFHQTPICRTRSRTELSSVSNCFEVCSGS